MNIELSKLKTNPNNPRIIRKDKLDKLVKSLREFPEMLEARPIVVDPDYVVLGGNMRLKAAQLAGLEKVPVYVASWDEAKGKQFVIKDNVSFGEWDWDMLANEWDNVDINDWGLDVWVPEADVDYSILDEEFGDIDEQVSEMKDSVKRALQIEFTADDYAVALELTGRLRKEGVYLGGIVIEALRKCVG